jgi:hypothetical protein
MAAVEAGFARMVAISSVLAERERQDVKFGEQDLADGTGPTVQPLFTLAPHSWNGYSPTAVRVMQDAQRTTDRLAETGAATWRDVLLEEVFEAIAARDDESLRRELVEVAAVAVQWVEAIDRRAADA